MEETALLRREKLATLRKRKADEDAGLVGRTSVRSGRRRDGDEEEEVEDEGALIKAHFRNYDPKTKTMKKTTAGRRVDDTVERAVEGLQAQVIAEDERRRQEELDLLNIAPKRPNWDLKRDLTKRLSKLERRKQEAILTLIRRRIAAERKASGISGNAQVSELNPLTAEMAASATADRSAAQIGIQSDGSNGDDADD